MNEKYDRKFILQSRNSDYDMGIERINLRLNNHKYKRRNIMRTTTMILLVACYTTCSSVHVQGNTVTSTSQSSNNFNNWEKHDNRNIATTSAKVIASTVGGATVTKKVVHSMPPPPPPPLQNSVSTTTSLSSSHYQGQNHPQRYKGHVPNNSRSNENQLHYRHSNTEPPPPPPPPPQYNVKSQSTISSTVLNDTHDTKNTSNMSKSELHTNNSTGLVKDYDNNIVSSTEKIIEQSKKSTQESEEKNTSHNTSTTPPHPPSHPSSTSTNNTNLNSVMNKTTDLNFSNTIPDRNKDLNQASLSQKNGTIQDDTMIDELTKSSHENKLPPPPPPPPHNNTPKQHENTLSSKNVPQLQRKENIINQSGIDYSSHPQRTTPPPPPPPHLQQNQYNSHQYHLNQYTEPPKSTFNYDQQQQHQAIQQRQQQQQLQQQNNYHEMRQQPSKIIQKYPPQYKQDQQMLPLNHPSYSQQQQQQYYRPQNLPPPRHQPHSQHPSLFSRLNQKLENLSDIDTIIAERTSSILRKTFYDVTKSATEVIHKKDGIFSGIMSKIAPSSTSGIGGKGAPTSSTETLDAWEKDRMDYIWEQRRRNWLKEDRSGSGTSSGTSSVSPLEQHLSSLVEQQQPQQQISSSLTAKTENVGTIDGKDSIVSNQFQRNIDHKHDPDEFYPIHDENEEQRNATTASSDNLIDPSTIFRSDFTNAAIQRPSNKPIQIPRHSASHNKKDYYGYEEDNSSILAKMKTFRMPKIVTSLPKFWSSSRYHSKSAVDSGWSDDDDDKDKNYDIRISSKNKDRIQSPRLKSQSISHSSNRNGLSPSQSSLSSINDLVDRYSKLSPISPTKANTINLLSSHDKSSCKQIGRMYALMDTVTLGSIMVALWQLILVWNKIKSNDSIPGNDGSFFSFVGYTHKIMEDFFHARSINDFKDAFKTLSSPPSGTSYQLIMDSWVLHAFTAVFLSICSKNVFLNPKVTYLIDQAKETIKSTTSYSQLYLRLMTGVLVIPEITTMMGEGIRSQVIAVTNIARFKMFLFLVVSTLIFTTVAVVKPILKAIAVAAYQVIGLDIWKHISSTSWDEIRDKLLLIMEPLYHTIHDMIMNELQRISENPLKVASRALIFLVLIVHYWLPTWQSYTLSSNLNKKNRKIGNALLTDVDRKSHITTAVSNMGSSSSNRLALQSRDNKTENLLEWWQLRQQSLSNQINLRRNKHSNGGLVFHHVFSYALLLLPIAMELYMNSRKYDGLSLNIDISQILGTIILLVFTNHLSCKVAMSIFDAYKGVDFIGGYLGLLKSTVDEVDKSMSNPNADLQQCVTASPSRGILVNDLWAAHVSKRAWACRGANIACKNGEVVAILGDDSSGKTRLLTAISEALISPPRQSRTTTIARGAVSVGGVDLNKWDRSRLKRKIGILLNDVRMLADQSILWSGFSLGEILEPPYDSTQSGVTGGNALALATQITGISSSLIPRLESKLATKLTTNEDELKAFSVNPQAKVNPISLNCLSPTEWSKVLLTKIIAEVISYNDNPTSSSDNIEGCMTGSILLLDDPFIYMSEIEEARLIKSLRKTGAAILLSSKRWSIGRLADKIVVVQNGCIVESGTHEELISRGAQQSIYASQWMQMTFSNK